MAEHAPGTGVLSQLTAETGRPAPKPLASLAGKPVRFGQITDKADMPQEKILSYTIGQK